MWHRIAFPFSPSCHGGTSSLHLSPNIRGHRPWKQQPFSGGFSSIISSAINFGLISGSGSRTAPNKTSVYGCDGNL